MRKSVLAFILVFLSISTFAGNLDLKTAVQTSLTHQANAASIRPIIYGGQDISRATYAAANDTSLNTQPTYAG